MDPREKIDTLSRDLVALLQQFEAPRRPVAPVLPEDMTMAPTCPAPLQACDPKKLEPWGLSCPPVSSAPQPLIADGEGRLCFRPQDLAAITPAIPTDDFDAELRKRAVALAYHIFDLGPAAGLELLSKKPPATTRSSTQAQQSHANTNAPLRANGLNRVASNFPNPPLITFAAARTAGRLERVSNAIQASLASSVALMRNAFGEVLPSINHLLAAATGEAAPDEMDVNNKTALINVVAGLGRLSGVLSSAPNVSQPDPSVKSILLTHVDVLATRERTTSEIDASVRTCIAAITHAVRAFDQLSVMMEPLANMKQELFATHRDIQARLNSMTHKQAAQATRDIENVITRAGSTFSEAQRRAREFEQALQEATELIVATQNAVDVASVPDTRDGIEVDFTATTPSEDIVWRHVLDVDDPTIVSRMAYALAGEEEEEEEEARAPPSFPDLALMHEPAVPTVEPINFAFQTDTSPQTCMLKSGAPADSASRVNAAVVALARAHIVDKDDTWTNEYSRALRMQLSAEERKQADAQAARFAVAWDAETSVNILSVMTRHVHAWFNAVTAYDEKQDELREVGKLAADSYLKTSSVNERMSVAWSKSIPVARAMMIGALVARVVCAIPDAREEMTHHTTVHIINFMRMAIPESSAPLDRGTLERASILYQSMMSVIWECRLESACADSKSVSEVCKVIGGVLSDAGMAFIDCGPFPTPPPDSLMGKALTHVRACLTLPKTEMPLRKADKSTPLSPLYQTLTYIIAHCTYATFLNVLVHASHTAQPLTEELLALVHALSNDALHAIVPEPPSPFNTLLDAYGKNEERGVGDVLRHLAYACGRGDPLSALTPETPTDMLAARGRVVSNKLAAIVRALPLPTRMPSPMHFVDVHAAITQGVHRFLSAAHMHLVAAVHGYSLQHIQNTIADVSWDVGGAESAAVRYGKFADAVMTFCERMLINAAQWLASSAALPPSDASAWMRDMAARLGAHVARQMRTDKSTHSPPGMTMVPPVGILPSVRPDTIAALDAMLDAQVLANVSDIVPPAIHVFTELAMAEHHAAREFAAPKKTNATPVPYDDATLIRMLPRLRERQWRRVVVEVKQHLKLDKSAAPKDDAGIRDLIQKTWRTDVPACLTNRTDIAIFDGVTLRISCGSVRADLLKAAWDRVKLAYATLTVRPSTSSLYLAAKQAQHEYQHAFVVRASLREAGTWREHEDAAFFRHLADNAHLASATLVQTCMNEANRGALSFDLLRHVFDLLVLEDCTSLAYENVHGEWEGAMTSRVVEGADGVQVCTSLERDPTHTRADNVRWQRRANLWLAVDTSVERKARAACRHAAVYSLYIVRAGSRHPYQSEALARLVHDATTLLQSYVDMGHGAQSVQALVDDATHNVTPPAALNEAAKGEWAHRMLTREDMVEAQHLDAEARAFVEARAAEALTQLAASAGCVVHVMNHAREFLGLTPDQLPDFFGARVTDLQREADAAVNLAIESLADDASRAMATRSRIIERVTEACGTWLTERQFSVDAKDATAYVMFQDDGAYTFPFIHWGVSRKTLAMALDAVREARAAAQAATVVDVKLRAFELALIARNLLREVDLCVSWVWNDGAAARIPRALTTLVTYLQHTHAALTRVASDMKDDTLADRVVGQLRGARVPATRVPATRVPATRVPATRGYAVLSSNVVQPGSERFPLDIPTDAAPAAFVGVSLDSHLEDVYMTMRINTLSAEHVASDGSTHVTGVAPFINLQLKKWF